MYIYIIITKRYKYNLQDNPKFKENQSMKQFLSKEKLQIKQQSGC